MSTNSQPVFVITHVSDLPETSARLLVLDEAPDQEGDGDRRGDAEDDLVESTALLRSSVVDRYVERGVRDHVVNG